MSHFPRVTHPIETVADLLEAARSQGLRLTTEQADFDRSGLDFLVAHARDEDGVPWIVRTPRRPDVLESALVEGRVLELVRACLPVEVPEWRVHTPDVIAYPRVEGTPAVTIDAPGAPRWNIIEPSAPSDTFLSSFAGALAALQSIPPEMAEKAGIPGKSIAAARASLGQSIAAMRSVLEPTEAVWARWQRWLADEDAWPRHTALVHGDLHPGHMLLDADGRLVGILDWTEAQVTDPSVDFAMFHGCFGGKALEALLSRFEGAGGQTWPRLAHHAAERWAAFPVLAAEWALRTGNEMALAYARNQLASVTAESGE